MLFLIALICGCFGHPFIGAFFLSCDVYFTFKSRIAVLEQEVATLKARAKDQDTKARINELRGPQTGVYVDMFDMEYPKYDQSKLWYVTNVGRDSEGRKTVLDFLKNKGIEVLEEESHFHFIRITLADDYEWGSLRNELRQQFSCDLQHDG